MNDKELAIKVAEKLGGLDWVWWLKQNKKITGDAPSIQKYLHDKAAEILFSEGMAGKIQEHLASTCGEKRHETINEWLVDWYYDFSPQKILTTYLEMEGE